MVQIECGNYGYLCDACQNRRITIDYTTWRNIRIVPFETPFVYSEPEDDNDFSDLPPLISDFEMNNNQLSSYFNSIEEFDHSNSN